MKKLIIKSLLAILNSRLLNATPCRYGFMAPELPQCDGHAPFEFIRGEGDSAEEDFDLVASEIPRPRW
jgi:hypothetical protein